MNYLCLAVITYLLPLAGAQKSIQAKTSSGTVQGYSPYPGVQAYLGIPYAQPPVGDLRFAPPEPITIPASEIIDGTSFGPSCYQFNFKGIMPDRGLVQTGESEDCLSLNVWTHDSADKLPVLMYIHGGGFGNGGSSIPIYNPIEIVKSHKDVVAVTINYRVNLFGYPNTKALEHLNPGLRDQRAAVEWVHKNIAAFGGDPNRITLFGESAGAMSVSLYSYTYASDPLVAGLSMLSGQPIGIQRDLGTEWPRIANATGCANEDSAKELECMRSKPALELKRAITPSLLNYFADPSGGTPVTDNETFFMLEEYTRRSAAGNFSHLPVLIGNTEDEGQAMIPYDPVKGVDDAFSKNLTEFVFHCPTSQHAADLVKANVPVWRYRYRAVWPSLTPYSWTGAYHSGELPMLFGSFKSMQFQPLSEDELAASKLMMQAWVSFAKDPQAGLLNDLEWPVYKPSAPTLVEMFKDNKPTVEFIDPTEYDSVCANPGLPAGQYGKYC